MSSEVQSILASWSPHPVLSAALLVPAVIYARGWWVIRKTRPGIFTAWRLTAFLLGLAILWLAVASPIDAFADVLLSAHMVQHLLLMSAVPPLLLLGAPVVPLLHGLPSWSRKHILGPAFFRSHWLRRLGTGLTNPLVAWAAMNLAYLGWHIPAAYDFALRDENWHAVEHLCFLFSSLLFWWPVVLPWPARARISPWMLLPYLLSADIVNTALAAFLAFCDRPIYSYYVTGPNPFHISPFTDQVAGAAIMWVIGSGVFLLPVIAISFHLLAPAKSSHNSLTCR